VVVGPELKRPINFIDFPEMQSEVERTAWTCFVSVVSGFLGKYEAENYRELVDRHVDAYQKMGCGMSPEVHVLYEFSLINSKITWETTQKNMVKDFTRMSGLSRNTVKDSTMKV